MNADAETVIDVEGLTKSFDGRVVVHDLSMKVKRGTIYGFLGPNGSGKTTTIRMLCGLLTPDSGHGTTLGFDILTQSDEIKRQVGYMTQKFSLYQDLTVRENLELVARIYGIANAKKAAQDMVQRLGLKGRENQLAGELSGGWKQRLALGACTLPNPKLLLLDEPTAGVDLSGKLTDKPGVDMVAPFGTSLHVSGRDHAALDATIKSYREDASLHWHESEPSLEDVFIELMGRAKDNFQKEAAPQKESAS